MSLRSAKADAWQARAVLNASRKFALDEANARTVTPSLEVGLRHDGGDAHTGNAVDVGIGALFANYSRSRVSAEIKMNKLVTHSDDYYREWTVFGSVRLAPDERGRGMSASLVQGNNTASSKSSCLYSDRNISAVVLDLQRRQFVAIPEIRDGLRIPGTDRITYRHRACRIATVRFGTQVLAGIPSRAGVERDFAVLRRVVSQRRISPG